MNIKKLTGEYGFSEDEIDFMNNSETATTADMNQSRIVSEFILGRKVVQAADKVIGSNEKLAASNEKYSKRMFWLTAALVSVGAVQILVQLFS